MGRYGLRIFHNMVPRSQPCKKIIRDSTKDPTTWSNAPIEANFYDLTSYKNNRNGAIAEKAGFVKFHNFTTADNLLAGIEFSSLDGVVDKMTSIIGGAIIGKTGNTEKLLDDASPHGIITPKSEYLYIKDVEFFKFDFNDAAALGTCSHCFHPASTDSGSRTIDVEGLKFTDVTKRIVYQYPYRAIFSDLDGSLTGKGPGSWATYYHEHHN